MSPEAVGDYLRGAKEAGLSWPPPESVDDARHEHRLFPVPPPSHAARPLPDWSAAGCQPLRAIDRLAAGPLPSIDMSVIAQAIADCEAEIERLQAEIKSLTGRRAAPRRRRRAAGTGAALLEVEDDRGGYRSPGTETARAGRGR